MTKRNRKKTFCFFSLYETFIQDSKRGKRLQPNGKRISKGTITNYTCTQKLLLAFAEKKKFTLRIRPASVLTKIERERERNYWKKFYKRFTDYLYDDCGYFDNYIGQTIKNIKVFFNYLNKDKAMEAGQFHKQFYVRKEEIPIFPLMPEELSYLIYDKELEKGLSSRMKQVKDVFVFGCTVALRISDLLALTKSNIRILNHQYYLSVRSIKTSTDTLIKLPEYAKAIVLKYNKTKGKLLPSFNKSNLNKYIKRLLEQAGFTHEVLVQRERRGKPVLLKKGQAKNKVYRFCDVASTHTMRRTAITTMLCLGMPEQVVRRISGHAPHTKEFFRYVLWAQIYQDQETEKVFEKLKEKQLQVA